MTSYVYEPWQAEEIQRVVRSMLAVHIPLKRAPLHEDFGGVDVHYIVNHAVGLQVRSRFNRPAYAADYDITFRSTEAPMMAKATYAPLAVFFWFQNHHIVAGRLVDVYRMRDRLTPPLLARPHCENGDGTAFQVVTIAELQDSSALLKIYDGNVWATATLGGDARLYRIVNGSHKTQGIIRNEVVPG
jgi:hypothetical protein